MDTNFAEKPENQTPGSSERPRRAEDQMPFWVSKLQKGFGDSTLFNLSFSLSEGELMWVSGANASGKTTLIDILSGFLSPDSGSFGLGARVLSGASAAKIAGNAVARTFQSPRRFGSITTTDLVRARAAQIRDARRLAPSVDEARVTILKAAALVDRLDTPVSALSYGEQRVVGLNLALIFAPRVLLLDEPAAGLSKPVQRAVADALQAYAFAGGIVVMTEHQASFADEIKTARLHLGNHSQ